MPGAGAGGTRLVGITPGLPEGTGGLERRVREALDAGIDLVVVRERSLPAWAEALATEEPDRVVLHARMAGAEAMAVATGCGLHLGGGARGPVAVRRWSRSLHHPDEVELTLQEGAAWVFLSPIWPPGSKPGDTRPCWGPEVLRRFVGRPVVALGGLTPKRAAACAGAWGVASLGGIFGARDVAEAVGAFRAALSASARPGARGS